MQKESAVSAWRFLVKPLPRSIRNAMEDSPVSLLSKAFGKAIRNNKLQTAFFERKALLLMLN